MTDSYTSPGLIERQRAKICSALSRMLLNYEANRAHAISEARAAINGMKKMRIDYSKQGLGMGFWHVGCESSRFPNSAVMMIVKDTGRDAVLECLHCHRKAKVLPGHIGVLECEEILD